MLSEDGCKENERPELNLEKDKGLVRAEAADEEIEGRWEAKEVMAMRIEQRVDVERWSLGV